MIVVFTPCHGFPEIFNETLRSIDSYVPGPLLHIIGDDFSPGDGSAKLMNLHEQDIYRDGAIVGQRRVFHCRDIGCTESPNMGESLKYIFNVCCHLSFEALLVVESDVILRQGVVEAFCQAHGLYGPKCGSVSPLFTEVGGDAISSFGGMLGKICGEPRVLSLDVGEKIGSWDQSAPRIDKLLWSHLACCYLPESTVRDTQINPDPAFRLYYADHDLSYAIRDAGLDVIVTDRAVAEHTRGCASTSVKWPDNSERALVERAAYNQLQEKWKGYGF